MSKNKTSIQCTLMRNRALKRNFLCVHRDELLPVISGMMAANMEISNELFTHDRDGNRIEVKMTPQAVYFCDDKGVKAFKALLHDLHFRMATDPDGLIKQRDTQINPLQAFDMDLEVFMSNFAYQEIVFSDKIGLSNTSDAHDIICTDTIDPISLGSDEDLYDDTSGFVVNISGSTGMVFVPGIEAGDLATLRPALVHDYQDVERYDHQPFVDEPGLSQDRAISPDEYQRTVSESLRISDLMVNF